MRHLIFLIAILVAGCTPEAEGPVTIRLWHQKTGAERAFFEKKIREYNARHADHRVEILYRETEDLRRLYIVASVGGKGPDVIFGPADNVGVFALTETIQPLDSIMSEAYLDRFSRQGIVSWEGQPWLLADQVGNHLTFVYNQDLLPRAPRTTQEMIDMLQRVTKDTNGDGESDQYGLTWNYREPFFFIPFLTGFGGWVMDDDGTPTLDTEATVRAIEFILDLRDKYGIIPAESDYQVADALFKDERAASIINGPWAWTSYAKAGVNYDLARLPKVSATDQWCAPMYSAKGYSVNVNVGPEKRSYVRRVLRYLTNAEMQRKMARELLTIPVLPAVRQSSVVQDNAKLQASLRQVKVARPMPIDPRMRQIWDGMRGPYQLVMNGTLSPEEGARRMQEEVMKRIRDAFL